MRTCGPTDSGEKWTCGLVRGRLEDNVGWQKVSRCCSLDFNDTLKDCVGDALTRTPRPSGQQVHESGKVKQCMPQIAWSEYMVL